MLGVGALREFDLSGEVAVDVEDVVGAAVEDQVVRVVWLDGAALIELYNEGNGSGDLDGLTLGVVSLGVRVRSLEHLLPREVDSLGG